ncbi:hydrolase 1, exosortase A system-associated [Sedimenticola thiotaurini]|uniref:hydrolase 1, exosortase A system-associated n=1 Tax=Sedimenticola thiotaurini TaxID=1543721 RepID=UPI000B1F93B3|nr:hydrolase 1, exosortase A system-associated [Sedimenticola thiotaurini]
MYPEFLQGPTGRLFSIRYLPPGDHLPNRWVLHLPALAEEMNKSRHMVSWQARQLALQGYGVLVADLFGTGESEGDFSDADWSCWKQDVQFLLQQLKKLGATDITLWGLRVGALLAVDVLKEAPELVNRLLLWQPVINGNQAMTQFLRLRLAAGMMAANGESMTELKQILSTGEILEVAGYGLSPALYTQLSAVTLQDMPVDLLTKTPVHWLEVVSAEGKPLNLQSKKLVSSWQEAGCSVHAEAVAGEPFWTTQELAIATQLIDRTTTLLSQDVDETADSQLSVDWETVSDVETPLTFECAGSRLVAVLHNPSSKRRRALLVVVGGPQYRAGSHREFVLLARAVADSGYPVLRFDYRGMGDSEGDYTGFDNIQDDIRAAVDSLQDHLPNVEEVVIWGLCDAATAAAFYAPGDPRVKGLALANPWVRSEEGEAKAFLKHYYIKRILSLGFWKKVLRGELNIAKSVSSLQSNVKAAAGAEQENSVPVSSAPGLAVRLENSLGDFNGQVLLILSGNDLTAAEFKDATKASRGFRRLLGQSRFKRFDLDASDHTFSRHEWLDLTIGRTISWLDEW